jgi:sterol 14-demethylase
MLFLASVTVLLSSETFRHAIEGWFADGSMVAAENVLIAFFTIVIVGCAMLLYKVLTTPDLPDGAKLPPVVSTGLPVFGPVLAFLKNPLEAVDNARKEYGDVFTINMFHIKSTFLIGSKAHKAFFEAMDDHLDQAPCYRFMIPVFGKGVVYDAPLKKRRQQMRFLGGSLRPSELRRYPGIIAKEAADFFKAYGASHTKDLLHAMADLTILTASATLHGPEVRQHLYKDVSRLFAELDKGISPLSILFPYLPTPAHRGRDKANKGMIDLFTKVIRERRAKQQAEGKAAKKGVDMLQKLMDSTYKDGTPVPDHEIAGLLISALFAGQHTSSITLTWTLLFLLKDARNGGKWLKKVKDELAAVEPFPGAFARGEVDHETVSKMDVLHACIKETLRMYPPLIFLMRRVVNKPLEVCGYHVPEGHNVWVSNAVAQRLPEVFPNPNTYDPSRWMTFDIRKLPPYSFIGFGAGIHTCMGESFAFMQLRTVLSVILSSFDLEMMGEFPAPSYEAMVVMPKGPNMIRFTRKTSAGTTGKGVAGPRAGAAKKAKKKKAVAATTAPSAHGAVSMNAAVDATFTPKEVAKHNTADDLWIIVKGKVYDVTTYLPVHQGGDAILKFAGKDATQGVYGPQHPSTVPKLLERYYIGDLAAE